MFSIVVDMSTTRATPAATWSEFATASPSLAAEVKALFEQYGQAFGFLATVRLDGGPRVHPVSPIIADGGLYCFVLASPKRRDLERDGRFALHAYPAENSDDEAYLAGRVRPVTDEMRQAQLARRHRASAQVNWRLFELHIEIAMVTHRERPQEPAEHRIWRAA
jgi:Pyridoxamine 5'-phosphate oxidase